MTLRAKRQLWVRVAVVFGAAIFVGLALMALSSILGSGPHVHANRGVKYPGFWSDWALLVMLVIAAPFAAVTAWKKWNNPDE